MGFNRCSIEDDRAQHPVLQLPDEPKLGSKREPKLTKPANQIKKSVKKGKPAQPDESKMTQQGSPFQPSPNQVLPWKSGMKRHRPGRQAKAAPDRTSKGPAPQVQRSQKNREPNTLGR